MALRSSFASIVIVMFYVKCCDAGSSDLSLQPKADEGILLIHNEDDVKAMHSILQFWSATTPNISDVLPGWSLNALPCDPAQGWSGVNCSAHAMDGATRTNGNTSVVVSLTIFGLTLQSPIPSISPSIIGELPATLGDLKNLEYLIIIGYRKLSGSIPQTVWQLPKLKTMNFQNNNLSGRIEIPPSFQGQLTYLDLSANSFDGQVPWNELNNHLNLSLVQINNNNFSGNLGRKLSASYKILDLSNNFFTGPLEFEKSDESNNDVGLTVLYITNNHFDGEFPTNNFPNLTSLDLSYNNFSGLGSIGIEGSMPLVTTLAMVSNKFEGEFPSSVLKNSKLGSIYCNFNKFTGSLILPQLAFQPSSLSTISILNNDIRSIIYPNSTSNSLLSAYNLDNTDILFLGGNPVCNQPRTPQLARLCRFNSSSRIVYGTQSSTYYNCGSQDSSNNNNKKVVIIVSSTISAMVFVIFVFATFIITNLMKKIMALRKIQQELSKKDVQPYIYSYNELKVATQDFHPRNKLGQGGFGVVHKGIMRDDTKVAVKQLMTSQQRLPEFLNEIVVISSVRHRNLVKLKGCCLSGDQRILVYEYVENKNLAEAIWGMPTTSGTHLDWSTRFNIMIGIAKGLAYLHEEVQPPIIHRDIKGQNILLDKNFEPKIADFGTALLFPTTNKEGSHLSIQEVAGTRGYLSPEYASYGHVSTKVDVYSFGVLILEIVSGRKNVDYNKPKDQQLLSDWAMRLSEENQLEELIDKNLTHFSPNNDIIHMINLGLACLHFMASDRPSMSDVVAMMLGNKTIETKFKYASSIEDNYSLSDTGNSVPSITRIAEDTSNFNHHHVV